MIEQPMTKTFVVCLTAVLALSFLPEKSFAQGSFGLGVQIGDPTGITGKFGVQGAAIDFAAAWSLNERFILQGHYLPARGRMTTEADMFYFMGPGAFLATRQRRGSDDFDLGLSGNFGMSYYYEAFEFFGQITPQFAFIPATRAYFRLGIGARYYF